MDNDTSDLIHEPEEPQPQDENENDVTAEKNQSKVWNGICREVLPIGTRNLGLCEVREVWEMAHCRSTL